MHICVSNLTIISSYNGLSSGQRQAIIWTNVEILLIRTLVANVSEIHKFSLKKMYLDMSAKRRLFRRGLNELTSDFTFHTYHMCNNNSHLWLKKNMNE